MHRRRHGKSRTPRNNRKPARRSPISAKISDPDGVASASVSYQLVDPGDYINIDDPRYSTAWTTLPMTGDDAGIYTAALPAELQTHRRLIRYRIDASDSKGANVTLPYRDDPTPNFAYFVYDGVPAWTGSWRPGREPEVNYSGELLGAVQTYHFITKREDHEEALHIPDTRASGYGGSDYKWQGTLVSDGKVYDHVRYRARGGVWRYAMGKNMWKFDFNRGQKFQARDDFGRKYKSAWSKLNFSSLIQQGNFNHRGEQGLFEGVGFRLFELAGVEACKTHYVPPPRHLPRGRER